MKISVCENCKKERELDYSGVREQWLCDKCEEELTDGLYID